MGYTLYLVKDNRPDADESVFSAADWRSMNETHPLSPWAYFDGTSVSVKNPTPDQIIALVQAARSHGWWVRGDDGEFYGEDGSPIPSSPTPAGRIDRVVQRARDFFAGRKLKRATAGLPCPFAVGDRVRTTYRTGGTVIKVDEKANHGMGGIKVRFPDGTVLGGSFVGHDFAKESPV